jgi:hypothetical protein
MVYKGDRMKKFEPFLIVLFLVFIYGCGSVPPTFLLSDYENNPVKTIGIFELKKDNFSNDEFEISKEDFNNVESIIIEKVLDRDYDVVAPIEYTGFGIDSDKDLTKEFITEICKKWKVDAILFSSISKYEDSFLGQHSLQMNFRLLKDDGDSIWTDKINLDRNSLLGFFGFVVGVTVAVLVYPDDTGSLSTGTRAAFGLGAGVLGGLLAEGLTNYISEAIAKRFETLPEGGGQGNRISY